MTVNGYTYKVGDLFTTLKSKKTGVIKEIIPNASGSVRVLLEMPTQDCYTKGNQGTRNCSSKTREGLRHTRRERSKVSESP